MAVLLDSKGQAWNVKFTIRNLKTVAEKTGIDVIKNGFGELTRAPIKAIEVAYYTSESVNSGMSLDNFYDLFETADGINAALEACVEALAVFTPSRGAEIRKLWKKTEEANSDLQTTADETMYQQLDALVAKAKEAMRNGEDPNLILGGSSGK